MQKKYNIVSALVMAALLAALLFSKSCSTEAASGFIREVIGLSGSQPVVRTKIKIDTVRDTIYRDSVRIVDRPVPVPEYVYIDSSLAGGSYDSVRVYVDTLTDSDVRLIYEAMVGGVLGDIDFSYEIIRPLQVNHTITERIVRYKYNDGFYLGSALLYGQNTDKLSLGLSASYQFKSSTTLGYSYLPFSKYHMLSVRKRVF